MKKTLLIPPYIYDGVTHSDKELSQRVKVFGGDTETYKGTPITLQLCGQDHKPELFWIKPQNILDTFLDYANDNLVRGEWGAFYFHNLDFDLVAMLYGYDLNKFRDTEFTIYRKKWKIDIFCGKRYFAKLSLQRNKTVYIIDSRAFLPFSLKKIAKELRLPVLKMDPPAGLGEKKFTPQDTDFVDYAKQDALVQTYVGEWIFNVHEKYRTPLSVSLPQFAGYLFRSKFLKPGDHIELPPKDILKAALLSYHGGKNGLYVPPGRYENCSEIDLNSAYPYAMKMLPSFLHGYYYKTAKYDPQHVGIYCISGRVKCPYNIFFDHSFVPIKDKFENLWVTSYELAEALRMDEVQLTSVWGYLWAPEDDRNPFGEYVDYFYKMKQATPKENSLYTFYKLGLNTLYGKTVQMVEIVNEETKKADYEMDFDETGKIKVKRIQRTYRAGGLFNPFIATLITGKVRAMIHSMEHKFQALHTATDSVKTLLPITGASNELGGYKLELRGTVLLFRNKLYLHYDEKNQLKKFALHGFLGNTEALLELYHSKTKKYKVDHLFRVREALIQKKVPLAMVKGLERQLNIDWEKFRE